MTMFPRDTRQNRTIVESLGGSCIRVCRQWQNSIAGYFIGFGILAGILAIDPLGAYLTWDGGGQGFDVSGVITMTWFMALSVGSLVVFGRPRVQIFPGGIVLRNVLRDVLIPFATVEEVNILESAHLRIRANHRWYRAWGLEKSNLHYALGTPGVAGAAADVIEDHAQAGHQPVSSDQTRVWWRSPEVQEVVLVLLWLGYVVAGALHTILMGAPAECTRFC